MVILLSFPTSVTLDASSAFSFSCDSSAAGGVVEDIIWSHETVNFTQAVNFTQEDIDNTARIDAPGNRLEFYPVLVADDGLYVCYFSTTTTIGYVRKESACIFVVGKLVSLATPTFIINPIHPIVPA